MFNGIRDFIQRGRKGYITSDLWQWDNFFSKLIVNSLREFKKNCHSYPSQDITWEEWMSILDEIIDCFEEQGRGVDNIPLKKNGKTLNFDAMRKREKLHADKLHRGFELLEKYYFDLWD